MVYEWNRKYGVMETNIEPGDNEKLEAIIVHDGKFHADDVMAVWIAKQINPDVNIMRTRNEKELVQGLTNPNVIVADVGEGMYDHHQKEGVRFYPTQEKGNQMAACGLVWDKWGEKVVETWVNNGKMILQPNETISTAAKQFRDYVLRPIEVKDTTVGREHVRSYLILQDKNGNLPDMEQESIVSDFIRSFNDIRFTLENEQLDDLHVFRKQVKNIESIVSTYDKSEANQYGLNPMIASLTRQNSDFLQLIENNYKEKEHDQELLDNFIRSKLEKLNPNARIFNIDFEYTNMDTFKDTNIQVILCSNKNHTEIQVRSVDPNIKLSDKYKEFGDNIFVHPQGHMCAIPITSNQDREAALEIAKSIGEKSILDTYDRAMDIEIDTKDIEIENKLDIDDVGDIDDDIDIEDPLDNIDIDDR